MITSNSVSFAHHSGDYRCGQPGQQHGRRCPPMSRLGICRIWSARVSVFFTDVVQQIHSFRASGVSLFQSASTFGCATSTMRRSAGTRCTTPVATFCFVAIFITSFYRSSQAGDRNPGRIRSTKVKHLGCIINNHFARKVSLVDLFYS